MTTNHAIEPRQGKFFGVVPIEWLDLPPELAGGDSCIRQQNGCSIDVDTDLDALALWLDAVTEDPTTRSQYRHCVEKCLLWATIERGKALSSLDEDDARAFEQFMGNPQPWEKWVRAATATRSSPYWRPFRGGLSIATRSHVVAILSQFFSWLAAHRYVRRDPWYHACHGVTREHRRERAPVTVGGFHHCMVTLPEWTYLRRILDSLPSNESGLRQRLIFHLGYYAGLMPGEIAQATVGAISIVSAERDGHPTAWRFDVAGRDSVRTSIILLPPVLDPLIRYLACRGVALSDMHKRKDTALIAPTRRVGSRERLPESARGALYQIGKGLFQRAAELARSEGNVIPAERLTRASLGWLTHAFENHCQQRGIDIGAVWNLLASKSVLSPMMLQYCRHRKIRTMDEIGKFIDELSPMWQLPEPSRSNET